MSNALKSNINLEDLNSVNVLTERVKNRKQEYENSPVWVSSSRARAFTESWKETEADPFHLRRAKAFARVLDESPAIIRDGELIVGSDTKFVRGAETMPEFNPYDILDAIEEDHFDGLSEVIIASVEEEDRNILKESASYWVGRSTHDIVHEAWRRELGKEYFDLLDDKVRVIESSIVVSPKPSTIFNPGTLMQGLSYIINRSSDEREKTINSVGQSSPQASYHKIVVLDAIIITCKALIKFADRHSEAANNMAMTESDPVRKRELEKIAQHCKRVPANPPRTFVEALQGLWFVLIGLKKETPCAPACLNRIDQYLYPFYMEDLREGRITQQEAAELLGLLWIKLNEFEAFRGKKMTKWGSGSLLQQVTISGQTKEGEDTTNEVSYLILEVSRQMKMPQPGVYVRYHNGISQEFMEKAAETNRDTGGGIPAFLNDQSAVDRLIALGVDHNDAIEWSAGGCLNYVVGHVQMHPRGLCYCNEAKILEITLNNGVD
ncbi:MAG: pyruvate formate lyase family protein, partial [bacterium]